MCVLHGPSSSDAWWLWRLSAGASSCAVRAWLSRGVRGAGAPPPACAARHGSLLRLCADDAGPPLFALAGAACSDGVTCAHASPLAALRASLSAASGGAAAAAAGGGVLVIDDIAGLLLAHSMGEVACALSALARGGALVLVPLDARLVGTQAFAALAALASLVVHLAGDGRPALLQHAPARGSATVTEVLSVRGGGGGARRHYCAARFKCGSASRRRAALPPPPPFLPLTQKMRRRARRTRTHKATPCPRLVRWPWERRSRPARPPRCGRGPLRRRRRRRRRQCRQTAAVRSRWPRRCRCQARRCCSPPMQSRRARRRDD